jgi:hypothetical protein
MIKAAQYFTERPSFISGSSTIKTILFALLFFPLFFWRLSGILPLIIHGQDRSKLGNVMKMFTHRLLYIVLGLPLTVFFSFEILIFLNENLLAEQANYRLQSDFSEGTSDIFLDLPGSKVHDPAPVLRSDIEIYHRYLVELFSPVVVHKISNHPEWDIPVSVDFDGNQDPRDNVVNEPDFRPHRAAIYGELTAETSDSYYLTYSLFHVKDYDHPIREMLTHWSYHDNDNEGLHIRVDKKSMRVAEVETWFHNRFLLFNRSGVSAGSEPVHGQIHTEGDTHIIVYAQPQGHGVRCAQWVDKDDFSTNVKILRYQSGEKCVPMYANRNPQYNVTYTIPNFDTWYEKALGPFGSQGKGTDMFEDWIEIGTYLDGSPIRIGKYIAGLDYAKGYWSRPKPMWSWDDGWDNIPVFIWHFFPSFSFESHSGTRLSHKYLYNRPVQKTFAMSPEDLVARLSLNVEVRGGPKWEGLESRGGHLARVEYYRAARHMLIGYVNYLFHALG